MNHIFYVGEHSETFRQTVELYQETYKEYERILVKMNNITKKIIENGIFQGKIYAKRIPKHPEFKLILESIFKKTFLKGYIFAESVNSPNYNNCRQISYNDIQDSPWICNYPDNDEICGKFVTVNKNNPNIYFCSLNLHQSYAKAMNLPRTIKDLDTMGYPLPEFHPIYFPCTSIVSTATAVPKKNRTSKRKCIDFENFKQNDVVAGSKESAKSGKVRKIVLSKKKECNKDIELIPRIQCVYNCLITGSPCQNYGTQKDPLDYEGITYCDQHVRVTDELVEKVKIANDLTLLKNLQDILLYDREIERLLYISKNFVLLNMDKEPVIIGANYESFKVENDLKVLCHKRYVSASEIGLGTPDFIINMFHESSRC